MTLNECPMRGRHLTVFLRDECPACNPKETVVESSKPGVCYCGEYGGGVHTKSARCERTSNPGDVDDWLIACARKAGFRQHQWDAMFFERQPYDVTYATIELKNFAQQILAGRNADETPAVPTVESRLWCNDALDDTTCRRLRGHAGLHGCHDEGVLTEWGDRPADKTTPLRYRANGTYWDGIPTQDMACENCGSGITKHTGKQLLCPDKTNEDKS